MANKFDGDVRPLSNDQRYMGVVFEGLMDDAIQQAYDAPDHGLAEQPTHPRSISRDRWNLLEHLNLTSHYLPNAVVGRTRALMIEMAADRISFENEAADAVKAEQEPGFYTLEYATKHWPDNFAAADNMVKRLRALNESQLVVYAEYRSEFGIRESLDKAEAYPYPAPSSKV